MSVSVIPLFENFFISNYYIDIISNEYNPRYFVTIQQECY